MIKHIIFTCLLVVAFVVGVTFYLEPNDFRKCSASPSEVVGCQAVDAIVVVSGGDTSARTAHAIELYQNGWADMLIVSGAAEDKSGPSNAEAMEAQAITAGVPESAIITETTSETTEENAENVQQIFTDNNISSAILVTSGYHQRRTYLEFIKYTSGVDIYNSPVTQDDDWSYTWFLTPRGWYLAGSEIVKIIIFHITGV